MKRLGVFCVFMIGTIALLALRPSGAGSFHDSLRDDMDEAYRMVDRNLTRVHYGVDELTDDWAQFSVGQRADGLFQGGIRYQFTGVTQIRFRVYSPKGTFAVPDSLGEMQFGTAGDREEIAPGSVTQARFDPVTGGVYVYDGGWKTLAGQPGRPELTPAEGYDGTGLIDYGVNVYAGSGRVRLIPTRVAIAQKAVDTVIFCAEDFVCSIPNGTTQLWIELNDAGGIILSRKEYRTSLAWVTLTGDSVGMGPPSAAPILQSSPSSLPEESLSSASSRARSTSSKAASSVSSAAAGSKASSSLETSSKFEGVITSSQSSAKPRASSSEKEEKAETPEVTQLAPAPVPTADYAEAAQVYEISRRAEKDPFDFGVILYIIAVAGVIAYLLIRPKKL